MNRDLYKIKIDSKLPSASAPRFVVRVNQLAETKLKFNRDAKVVKEAK